VNFLNNKAQAKEGRNGWVQSKSYICISSIFPDNITFIITLYDAMYLHERDYLVLVFCHQETQRFYYFSFALTATSITRNVSILIISDK